MQDSILNLSGEHSVIYLGKSRHAYKLNVTLFNDSVFCMGKNNYINQQLRVILSEQKHCFIGDSGVFSMGICMRNADPHLIYHCETGRRINPTKSIYIGDHVWVGQDCLILKGTQIDSGSIIGGGSVLAGARIPHNVVWAGNPARQISDDVFWDAACVHKWTQEQTAVSDNYTDYIDRYRPTYSKDFWIYNYVEGETVEYSIIDEKLTGCENSQERVEYLVEMNKAKSKNRFVHQL